MPLTVANPTRRAQKGPWALARRATAYSLLACAGFALGASNCGGSTATSDVEDACSAFASSYLNTTERCDGRVLPADVAAEFRARNRAFCVQGTQLPGSGFTAKGMNDCASAEATISCHDPRIPAACANVVGTLANGAACNANAQCQSGLCVLGTTGNPDGGAALVNPCGTCEATVALGAACDATSFCAPGGLCVGGTCIAYASVDVGGACQLNDDCKDGLECSKQKCVPQARNGGTCNGIGDCPDDLRCIGGTCSPPIADGASCATAADGCALGSACPYNTKICTHAAIVSPGARCGLSPLAACAIGACDLTDPVNDQGTCPTVIPDGAACIAGDPTKTCDLFSTCVGGVCTPPVGSACR